MQSSLAWKVAVCLAAIWVVPTHWLIGLNLLLGIQQADWQVGGVRFDGGDLAIGAIAASVAVRGLPRGASWRRALPRQRLWMALAACLMVSYASAPENQVNMTDPVRIGYQLYRYALRVVILYPVCGLLLSTRRKFDDLLVWMVVAADLCALVAIPQGYAGERVTGPFTTKNALGMALGVPSMLVFADFLAGGRSALTLVSIPLLIRGLLFASSRGAFASVALGTAAAWFLMYRGRVRTHMLTAVSAGVVALVVLLAFKPDLFERPTIARVFTTVNLEEGTLQWRIRERWPHFTHRALEHPWVGWGTNVDLSLGPALNTPHNAYLSVAVANGLPALGLFVSFLCLALRDAWRVSTRAGDQTDRVRAAKIAGAIACVMVHGMIDSIFMMPFVLGEIWVLCIGARRLADGTWQPVRRDVPDGERPQSPANGEVGRGS